MTDIATYEARIAAALGRLAAAVERMGPAAAPPDPGLAAALEAERQANAHLSDRVRALRARQDATVTALERRIADLTRLLDERSAELDRLRSAHAGLVSAVQALRDTDAGAAEGDAAALEAATLRVARDADVAAMDDLLSALDPLVQDAEAARAGA